MFRPEKKVINRGRSIHTVSWTGVLFTPRQTELAVELAGVQS